MLFKFGNFECEIDTSDCGFMELFETKSLELAEASEKTQKDGKRSDVIKAMSALSFSYFDALFGEGTAALMFGDKVNLRLCDAAMFALCDAIMEDQKAYNNEVKASLASRQGNRAQRRQKK